ncbi:MAG: hypothetical protein IKZ87_07010 [Actinomycetaceae bacterium]|nr:hypothetical protein [Actinomycetaceae bacterium]
MVEQHNFASVLNQAITSSGLSLTDIVNELDKQDLTLSAASLSYWKTGKSLPTRKSSLPILSAIEAMCSLPAGTLIKAARADSQANNNRQILSSASHTRVPDNVRSQVPKEAEDTEKDVNWEQEAEREILIDSHHISADFRGMRSEIMILSRIVTPTRSHLHVSSYLSEAEEKFSDTETGIRYLEGASVGEIIRHENNQTLTLRLDLPETCKVGDLHRVFYLPAPFTHPSPCKQSPNRYLAWPLRMYTCNLVFEGEVPENIEWVTEGTQERAGSRIKQVTTQRVYPSGNTVQISLENVKGIVGYFRWS